MANDNNLEFIREKISQLRNAIMYVNGSGLVKPGNDIVTTVRIDEGGQLWFVTNHPARFVEECEQSFPEKLHFYRKGVDFFMEISGKATIVNNYSIDYTVSAKVAGMNGSGGILVKMAITNIEYTEPHAKRPKNKIETLMENGYNWFLRTVAVHH